MRGSKAKMLRRAAEYRTARDRAEYDKPELKRVAGMPTFETYTRTVRTMGPAGKVIASEVVKIRYGRNGKAPLKPIIAPEVDKDTGRITFVPQVQFVPIVKPRRLAAGSSRKVYHALKTMERREGLDKVFARSLKEAGT